MKVRFKKLVPHAVTPSYSKVGDAGLDLTAISVKETEDYIQYGTGIAVEIPENHVGLLCPRSSVTDLEIMMKNSIGIIDSNYRGELKLRYQTTKNMTLVDTNRYIYYGKKYELGERAGQLIIVPIPHIELIESEELSETVRGENGYGSTGK